MIARINDIQNFKHKIIFAYSKNAQTLSLRKLYKLSGNQYYLHVKPIFHVFRFMTIPYNLLTAKNIHIQFYNQQIRKYHYYLKKLKKQQVHKKPKTSQFDQLLSRTTDFQSMYFLRIIFVISLLISFAIPLFFIYEERLQNDDFIKYISDRPRIIGVYINSKKEVKLRCERKYTTTRYLDSFLQKIQSTQKNFSHILFFNNRFFTQQSPLLSSLIIGLFYCFIIYRLSRYFRFNKNQINIFSSIFGKQKQPIKPETIKINFKDIQGQQQAKKQIMEFVDILQNQQKYRHMGAKVPRGALLTGPPGVGKTMLGKATAKEANVNFFYASGSEFVEMIYGLGSYRIKELFKNAKNNAPAIIFIDQLDSIGRKKESVIRNDQRSNTLNQLLIEIDGFSSNQKVILFAATNKKQMLDPALTRAGRLDRGIEIGYPSISQRKLIFLHYLKTIKLQSNRKDQVQKIAERLASLTPQFTGAQIENVCNQGAILAARKSQKYVTLKDFEMAMERVIGGIQKKKPFSEEEKKIVAYHQSGHAVINWFSENSQSLLKLTIIPRTKGSLGFSQYLPKQSNFYTKQDLLNKIRFFLAGRLTQQYFFKKMSSSAQDDLLKASEIAEKIVKQYGMSKQVQYLSFQKEKFPKLYSRKTQNIMEKEKQSIIKQAEERVRQFIKEKQELIVALSEELLKKQILIEEELVAILGNKTQ